MPHAVDAEFVAANPGRTLLREAACVLAGGGLVALCAKIQVPTVPVPMTLQTFAVLLVGAALGGRRGTLTMLAYLSAGIAGLPVFAGPIAGPAYVFGPTGGYLLAFLPAAWLAGVLADERRGRGPAVSMLALLFADAVVLSSGWAWLSATIGPAAGWKVGVAPFLGWNVLKVALAVTALHGGRRFLAGLGRNAAA